MILEVGDKAAGTQNSRANIDPAVFILRLKVLPYAAPQCTAGITRQFTHHQVIQYRIADGLSTLALGLERNGDCLYTHNFDVEAINDPTPGSTATAFTAVELATRTTNILGDITFNSASLINPDLVDAPLLVETYEDPELSIAVTDVTKEGWY